MANNASVYSFGLYFFGDLYTILNGARTAGIGQILAIVLEIVLEIGLEIDS